MCNKTYSYSYCLLEKMTPCNMYKIVNHPTRVGLIVKKVVDMLLICLTHHSSKDRWVVISHDSLYAYQYPETMLLTWAYSSLGHWSNSLLIMWQPTHEYHVSWGSFRCWHCWTMSSTWVICSLHNALLMNATHFLCSRGFLVEKLLLTR